jgi:acetolactate synthase I/III small subunit
VNITPLSMIVMITGESRKVDAAVGMFSQFTILATVRTGNIVMVRGEQAT